MNSDLDNWDPRRHDYENKNFNSYNRGLGQDLQIQQSNSRTQDNRHVQLFVTGIPLQIEDEGLVNLFSGAGTVITAYKKRPKYEGSSETFGFVTMASVDDARRAIQEFDGYKINMGRHCSYLRVRVSLDKAQLEQKLQQRQNPLQHAGIEDFDPMADGSDDDLDMRSKPKMQTTENVGPQGAAATYPSKGRGHNLSRDVSGATSLSPRPGSLQSTQNSVNGDAMSPTISHSGALEVDIDNQLKRKTSSRCIGRGSNNRESLLMSPEFCDGYLRTPELRSRQEDYCDYRDQRRHWHNSAYEDTGYYTDTGCGYYSNRYPAQAMVRRVGMANYMAPAPMAACYVEPQTVPMVPAHSVHLLQPAYAQPAIMNASIIANTSMNRTQINQRTLNTVSDGDDECMVCGKIGSYRCSNCKSPYCSATCQRTDWPRHKPMCSTIKKKPEHMRLYDGVDVGEEIIPRMAMEKAVGDTVEVMRPSPPVRSRQASTESRSTLPNNRPIPDLSGQNNREQRGDKYIKSCFNCGATSHMRNECPNEPCCFNCGDTSHKKSECPKPHGYRKRRSTDRSDYKSNGHHEAEDDDSVLSNLRPTTTVLTNKSPQTNGHADRGATQESQYKAAHKPLAESTPKTVAGMESQETSPVSRIAVSPAPRKSLTSALMPLNEQVQVVVTEVKDPANLWLQMITQECITDLTTITETLEQKYSDSNSCSVSCVMVGELYAGKFSVDNQWYRVQVQSVVKDEIIVLFVDFGNTEATQLHQLRQLDQSLERFPAQAIHCELAGILPLDTKWTIPSPQLEQFIKTNIKYSGVCVSVQSTRLGQVHRITLTSEEGTDVAQALVDAGLAQAADAKKSPNKSKDPVMIQDLTRGLDMLSIGDEELIVITGAKSPIEFGIQIPNEQFSKFNEKFQKTCQNMEQKEYRPQRVGELVACRYEGDNDWYRAEVLEKNVDGEAMVLYIDYLNTAAVTPVMMREADRACMGVPVQGIRCTLDGIQQPAHGEWPPAVATVLAEYSQGQLKACVKAIKDNIMSLEMISSDGVSVNDILQTILQKDELDRKAANSNKEKSPEVNQTRPVKSTTPKAVIENQVAEMVSLMKNASMGVGITAGELALGEKTVVSVTTVSALDEIYVQFQDIPDVEKLANIQTELTQTCQEASGFVPNVGDYIAAKFVDGVWYRGVVRAKSDTSEEFSVLFVDYGNTEVIKKDLISPLDAKFCSLHTMAVRCQLRGTENLPVEVVSDLQNLCNSQFTVKAVACREGIYSVDMNLMDGKSVNEIFVENVFSNEETESITVQPAANTQEAVSTVGVNTNEIAPKAVCTIEDRSLPLDGTNITSEVIHIETIDSFYIRTNSETIQLELANIQQTLYRVCEANSVVYTPTCVGECVAAKYTEDGFTMWYRARVVQKDTDRVRVFILDYGNTDWVPVTDVRTLDQSVVSVPAMVVKCRLKGSTGGQNTELNEDFQTVKQVPVGVIALEKQDDRYLVDLILDNSASASDILQLQPEDDPVTEDTVNQTDTIPVSPVPSGSGTSPQSNVQQPQTATQTPAVAVQNAEASPASKSPPTIKPSALISCVQLPIGQTVSAATFWIENIRSFYVQLAEEKLQITFSEMMVHMSGVFENSGPAHQPVLGEIVAAHYDDGSQAMWYRAQILEIVDDTCMAFFLDYGNSDHVPVNNIRKLPDQFLSQPSMAIHCSLAGHGEQTCEMQSAFQEFLNIEMKCKALGVHNSQYEVELESIDGVNINKKLGLVTPQAAAPSINTSPTSQILDHLPKPVGPSTNTLPMKTMSPPKGERKAFFTQTLSKSKPSSKHVQVVITSIVRPNLFHCQQYQEDEETLRDLKLLSDTMGLECDPEIPSLQHIKFEVGELCCARFPVEGGHWYRASIMDVLSDNTVKVEYVDFGNQADVPVRQLRPATEEYTRLPLLAFSCSLHGVVPAGSCWTEQALAVMTQYQNVPVQATIINVDNGVYELEITDGNNRSLAKHLIDEGLAKAVSKSTGATSEMEMMKRQNEILQKQLELMTAQIADLKKGK